MSASSVQQLQGAVRQRLWQARFIAGMRAALWASTVLLVVWMLALLAGYKAPVGVAWGLAAVLWLALLGRAAVQRPSDAECALWADRRLGGASAFTTLLELQSSAAVPAQAEPLRWLQKWADDHAPQALQQLAAQRVPAQLMQPLLVTLVCLALAAVVLVLHRPEPTTAAAGADAAAATAQAAQPARATAAASAADAAPVLGGGGEQAPLVSELSKALRAGESRAAPARGAAGAGAEAGPDNGRAGAAEEPTSAPAQAPTTPRTMTAAAGGGDATEAPLPAGMTRIAGNSAGNSAGLSVAARAGTDAAGQAGDSRDLRADVGVSPVLQAPFPMQRSVPGGRPASPDQRADLDQSGTYAAEAGRTGRTGLNVANAAAATPPPATQATRLTGSESSYVQAWMKASGNGPRSPSPRSPSPRSPNP